MARNLLRRAAALLLLGLSGCAEAAALTARAGQDGSSIVFVSDGGVVVESTVLSGHGTEPGLEPMGVVPSPGSGTGLLRDPEDGNQRVMLGDGPSVKFTSIDANSVRVEVADPGAQAIGASFDFEPDELFYGVWEYPWNGTITNQGIVYPTYGVYGWVRGVNWANARAPFFFTKSGFAVYADTLAVGTFDFSRPRRASFRFNTSALTYTVTYDGDLLSLLTRFAALSSTIEMPPDAGYGPTFWSDDFEQDFHGGVSNAQENYYDVVDHLYYNRIRATGMVADRPYGTGTNGWGNFDFDPDFYPDPEGLIRNLTAYGFEVQAWVGNRAYYHTELYNTSLKNGWLFPEIDPVAYDGPALNLSIPEAYDYFLEKLSYFPRLGIRGYKIDRGEEHEMPDAEQNVQMALFEKLCHESMAAVYGGGNFYNFARSAYDRSRGHTAVWNGDAYPTFEGLAYTVASGIRAGLLGYAQWGSDTGGYLRDEDPDVASPTEEVWARWMQASAFAPMYEVLLGRGHTPWYKPYSARLVEALRYTADVHTRLVPYIRSYVYQATLTGIPVIRALFLEFPGDEAVYETADAYAFGAELLVAPVVNAGGSRTVYFPRDGAGRRFVEYFNKTAVYHPGTTLEITNHSLTGGPPVFAREGAIIPTGDVRLGNALWLLPDWRPYLEVEVFPSFEAPESSFEYFRGRELPGGGSATIRVTADVATRRTTRELRVECPDLGVDGVLRIYGRKSGGGLATLDIPLPPGGTNLILVAKVRGFTSLFGGYGEGDGDDEEEGYEEEGEGTEWPQVEWEHVPGP